MTQVNNKEHELAIWLNEQEENYHPDISKSKGMLRDPECHKLYTEFINDPKYSKYLTKKQTKEAIKTTIKALLFRADKENVILVDIPLTEMFGNEELDMDYVKKKMKVDRFEFYGFGDYWFIMDDGMCDATREFNSVFNKMFKKVPCINRMLEPTGNYLMFKMVDYKRMDIETDLRYITNKLKQL
jgi:hypothetical protein